MGGGKPREPFLFYLSYTQDDLKRAFASEIIPSILLKDSKFPQTVAQGWIKTPAINPSPGAIAHRYVLPGKDLAKLISREKVLLKKIHRRISPVDVSRGGPPGMSIIFHNFPLSLNTLELD